MKHTPKKNSPAVVAASPPSPPQPLLLPSSPSVAPIVGDWLSATQLASALPFIPGLDDRMLRRLADANNPNPRTHSAWIPKPVRARWQYTPTLAGLLEWFHARATATRPAHYPSMDALEADLRIPKKFTQWALRHGAAEAQRQNNTLDARPIQEKAFAILALVPTGKITGIEGMEEVNTNIELGLKIREEREALQRKALLEKGSMLFLKHGQGAIPELLADEILWEKTLQPLRAALLKAPAAINRHHRTILSSDATMPEKIRQCAHATTATTAAILDKLRAKIPPRRVAPAGQFEEKEIAA